MRIVSWNCNGALRNKREKIDRLQADILIIQECEDPYQSTIDYKNWASHYLWVGSSKNKGVGIFSRKDLILKSLNWNKTYHLSINNQPSRIFWQTKDLKLFLPFQVDDYIIIAVWTKRCEEEAFSYIGQVWKFLQIHKTDIIQKKVIIIGDFNSNAIWDKLDCWWNHSDIVRDLEDIKIKSLYHTLFKEEQGKETTATFYMQKNKNKPYHTDYAFCSSELLKNSKMQIGDPDEWLKFSDHMPLIIQL